MARKKSTRKASKTGKASRKVQRAAGGRAKGVKRRAVPVRPLVLGGAGRAGAKGAGREGGGLGGPHARLGRRPPLARELLALYGEVGRLARATREEEERLRLREQQDAMGVQIDEVIARTIREDTEEYREAGIALVAASHRIEDALADLSRVADAIVGAARVVDAVARVLSAATGPV
jgi:hypothetical protein